MVTWYLGISMESTRKIEILVGLFVTIGLAALLVLAVKVSHFGGFTPEQTYSVTAYFENVGGLRENAPISMSGVKVGEVSSIDYDPKRYQAVVTMRIYSKYNFLSSDTQASIYTAGLLGAQYITLALGAEDTVLKDGDIIQHTQSALVLEEIIGQFLVNVASKK